jgi:Raf-like protein
MNITSPAFTENAKLPKIYAKLGGNQRPPLEIGDVPANAKSLAIICHDPDAPGRDGFYHWTVWNLPAKTTEITSGSLPVDAVEGITSWGRPGWNGPQPPFGTHRYQFYVYALNTVLDLPGNTKPKELIATMKPHIVEQAVLTGKFGVLDILRHG